MAVVSYKGRESARNSRKVMGSDSVERKTDIIMFLLVVVLLGGNSIALWSPVGLANMAAQPE